MTLLRHTHRWGTTFEAWHVVDEADQAELLWTTENWQNDIEKPFDASRSPMSTGRRFSGARFRPRSAAAIGTGEPEVR